MQNIVEKYTAPIKIVPVPMQIAPIKIVPVPMQIAQLLNTGSTFNDLTLERKNYIK